MIEVVHGGPRCARIDSYCLATGLGNKKSFREFIAIFNTTVILETETMNQMNEKTQESHEYKRQLRKREQNEEGLSEKQSKNDDDAPATKYFTQLRLQRRCE